MATTQNYTLFLFNDPATTEIYTLSLHDALPICATGRHPLKIVEVEAIPFAIPYKKPLRFASGEVHVADRKSTRLNSSHANISYAVFCLKKKSSQYLVFRLLFEKKYNTRTSPTHC